MTSTDGSGLVAPRLDVVRRVVASLVAGSVPVALGGSGLLAALGLVDRVRDWDLTTDGTPEQVIAALTAAGWRSPRWSPAMPVSARERVCGWTRVIMTWS